MLMVKEIFGPTLQGEGDLAGTPALFVRFTGCNIWNGDLRTRHKTACPYCDTDFVGGEKLSPADVFAELMHIAKDSLKKYLIVLSGGEPLLQNQDDLAELIRKIRGEGAITQFETNGTKAIESGLLSSTINGVHITCSPKVNPNKLKIQIDYVDCWKVLYPHPTIDLEAWKNFPKNNPNPVADYCLQPIEAQMPEAYTTNTYDTHKNMTETVLKVMEWGSPWRLSLQQHKLLGLK